MVVCLMSDNFNVFKIHVMMTFMNMARKFGVMIEHQDSLFVLGNLHLQWSFGLAIVYKIALTPIDSVHYSRWWSVGFCILMKVKSQPKRLAKMYKSVAKHGTFIDYVIPWLHLLNFKCMYAAMIFHSKVVILLSVTTEGKGDHGVSQQSYHPCMFVVNGL